MGDEGPFEGLGVITDTETGYAVLFDAVSGWSFGPVFTDGPDEAGGYLMFVKANGFDAPTECTVDDLKEMYDAFTAMMESLDAQDDD